jgi:fused signal recognition particle receptor
MGFFDKIKKKVSSAIEKTSEVIEKTSEAIGFKKLQTGLEKTRKSFIKKIQSIIGVGRKIDQELIDEIEEILITADIGVDTAERIIDVVNDRVKKDKLETADKINDIIKDELRSILLESPHANLDKNYMIEDDKKPHVIMIIGVNGVGKTTTIGKLAHNYKKAGKKVVIGAADTFRAAANEQLEIWADRAGVDIIQQKQGADPAAVAYDTFQSAIAKDFDVVLIDTAGRLHNKAPLMAELEKISRVMKKIRDYAPNEVYLVLDATTGQNAVQQAKEFMKVSRITGIILTKLDGTAKGGVVFPIANELKIPVRYIGVGEKIDDLQPFDPEAFVTALFGKEEVVEVEEIVKEGEEGYDEIED